MCKPFDYNLKNIHISNEKKKKNLAQEAMVAKASPLQLKN